MFKALIVIELSANMSGGFEGGGLVLQGEYHLSTGKNCFINFYWFSVASLNFICTFLKLQVPHPVCIGGTV